MNIIYGLIAASLVFTASAQANTDGFTECNSSRLELTLVQTFQIHGQSANWISVRKNSFQPDRVFPIQVFAKNNLAASSILFSGTTYNLNNVDICYDGSRIYLLHPKGTLSVYRKGQSESDSVVRLSQKNGILKFYLRPQTVVN